MVWPLVILAVPTALAGLVLGVPPEGGIIHTWLEDVFHSSEEAGILAGSIASGEHHGFELFGVGGALLGTGAAVAIAGIWLAHRWYVSNPEAPKRFVERIPFGLGPGMYAASVNKYYIDDIYQLVFVRTGLLLADVLWWFDVHVIDGAVNGAGWLASRIGGLLRHVQTGRVENYGLGIATGMILVLIAYLVIR